MAEILRGNDIAPARGRLGVLMPGLGAVASTLLTGLFAARKGLARPIGSLTQTGKIRLGKRTEGRFDYIKDFLPLTGLSDMVFGAWDIFPDTAYTAAAKAKVAANPADTRAGASLGTLYIQRGEREKGEQVFRGVISRSQPSLARFRRLRLGARNKHRKRTIHVFGKFDELDTGLC